LAPGNAKAHAAHRIDPCLMQEERDLEVADGEKIPHAPGSPLLPASVRPSSRKWKLSSVAGESSSPRAIASRWARAAMVSNPSSPESTTRRFEPATRWRSIQPLARLRRVE